MRCRILLPTAAALTFLLAALSTGSPLLLMMAILIALFLAAGFFSVLWAAKTMAFSGSLDQKTDKRGEEVLLRMEVRHRGLIPIAPVTLEISSAPGQPARELRLRDRPGRRQALSLPFRADHVGLLSPGVRAWRIEDLMGFFRYRREVDTELFRLLVLPATFETEPLVMAPGDPGSEFMARAMEDLSEPSDVRSYQNGDPMKKIHWKLSLRKGELMVRKFDEPILQEALILMDCSRPPSWGHPEAEADIRDALLETAASVFAGQEGNDLTVHMPLLGAHPVELDKTMGMPLAMENLARVDFSETDRFERVLTLESRRLRKVGCLVVVSARLNSAMVDVMTRMRSMGPNIRLYLITFAPEDSRVLPLISRLQQAGIQVSYVTPAGGALRREERRDPPRESV